MRLKNILLFVILLIYAGYYFGVSKGYIKKTSLRVKDAAEISFTQRVLDVITPDSPEERLMKANERIVELKTQLAWAKSDLDNYKNWRANAIANPPK